MRHPLTAAASWPLVGRDEELAFIADERRAGRVAGVVLSGSAGVGKTRLALEALREAERGGDATASAVASRAAATIPFGALAPLLPAVGGGALGVLRSAAAALAGRAAGRPLMLAVDDADLLDGPSAALVHQLARARAAFVVVTVRTGERPPDPIVALWKDGLCEYLELQPLSREQLGRLLRDALGGDLDGRTLHRLWTASRGNPMFVRELVLDALERGLLIETGGLWRTRAAPTAGRRLVELVESRLGELDRAEQAALGLLAFGEPLGVSLLESLSSRDVIEALERRGVLDVHHDGRRMETRLAHPLFGQALRARSGVLAAHAVQRELADALTATGARRRADVLRLATWWLESGSQGPADLLVDAARQAQAGLDAALAERLARAAIEAGGGPAARHALARALARQGRGDEAEALFERLEREATSDADHRVLAEARARNLLWALGRGEDAERALARAETAVADPSVRDDLAAVRGWMLCFLGRPADALAITTPVLERTDERTSVRVRAALAVANAMAISGRPAAAADLAARHRTAALSLADRRPLLAAQLETVRLLGLLLSGRLVEGAAAAREDYEIAIAAGIEEASALFASGAGAIAMARGEIAAAIRWLTEAVALMRDFDPLGFLPWTLAFLAQAAGQAADAATASAAAEEARALQRGGTHMFDADVGLARAWAAAAGGELSRARSAAREAADRAHAHGHDTFTLLALHDLARLGDATAAAPRLASLAARSDSRFAHARAEHAAALVDRDGGALEHASATLEATGALLLAAEAAGAAAVAHRDAGRAATARAVAARAARLAERCDGARTPGLPTAGPLDELTDREREIATLAAAGLSNPEIAARLVLSVRTVENHLQRSYGKLGLSNRDQLAPLFEPPSAAVPPRHLR